MSINRPCHRDPKMNETLQGFCALVTVRHMPPNVPLLVLFHFCQCDLKAGTDKKKIPINQRDLGIVYK